MGDGLVEGIGEGIGTEWAWGEGALFTKTVGSGLGLATVTGVRLGLADGTGDGLGEMTGTGEGLMAKLASSKCKRTTLVDIESQLVVEPASGKGRPPCEVDSRTIAS